MTSYSIVIHGGAGSIEKELTDKYQQGLEEALGRGTKILAKGGSSLEAITASILSLEDNPLFNAGCGASLTENETAELDASIMDGRDLACGAVAGVTETKNPILAAKKVMEKTPYILLQGRSADQFAKEEGLEIVLPQYFITEQRVKQLNIAKKNKTITLDHMSTGDELQDRSSKMGTVGAVAIDVNGNIAAGTSTGGMTNKRSGRVGDTALIGASTYAANGICGISCTGVGEEFIRHSVSHTIFSLMKYSNYALSEAVKEVFKILPPNTGGIIAVDKDGKIVASKNTPELLWSSYSNK